ncbi:hypothetical protein BH11MYX1_BH11MYX1_54670 [soil metagenome]
MIPRRYQVKKEAAAIVERGHPWLFREQMSTAAQAFGDGDWLRLVDGENRVIGHGIYEAEGAIAVRMLRTGAARPDASWVRSQLAAALAKRASLAHQTDAIRLVNGESDGLAAVVVDRFAETLVVASYAPGADALARYVAMVLAAAARGGLTLKITIPAAPETEGDAAATQPIEIVREHSELDAGLTRPIAVTRVAAAAAIPQAPAATTAPAAASIIGRATNVILRPARRRRGPPTSQRALCGTAPTTVEFHEDGRALAVDLEGGHKTGTYLDLRGLRRALVALPLAGARVLNLFAYTGMLGRAAELAGARHIQQVDQSARALAFAGAHHVGSADHHTFTVADVFEWLPSLAETEQFDLVIVAPPAMASKQTQIPAVLAAYRKLYRAAARHVMPGGAVVAACCTSRIDRELFKRTVREALGPGFQLERDVPPEPDHPVGFPQADYLKIALWRRS